MAAAVMGDFDAFMLMLAKVSLAGVDVTLQCLTRECAGGVEVKVYAYLRVSGKDQGLLAKVLSVVPNIVGSSTHGAET